MLQLIATQGLGSPLFVFDGGLRSSSEFVATPPRLSPAVRGQGALESEPGSASNSEPEHVSVDAISLDTVLFMLIGRLFFSTKLFSGIHDLWHGHADSCIR